MRYKHDKLRIPNACLILFVWVFTFWYILTWVNPTYSCPLHSCLLCMYANTLFAWKKIYCWRLKFSSPILIMTPPFFRLFPPGLPWRLCVLLCFVTVQDTRAIWRLLMYQRTNAREAKKNLKKILLNNRQRWGLRRSDCTLLHSPRTNLGKIISLCLVTATRPWTGTLMHNSFGCYFWMLVGVQQNLCR